MRARRLAAILIALTVAAAPPFGPAACAPAEDQRAVAQPVDAVAWVDGLDAGLAAASERNVPALVYVRRLSPPSRACVELGQRVFSLEGASALSERFVAVRLTAGDGADPSVLRFLGRHGVAAIPSLLVVNGRGHLLAADAGRSLNEMLSALEAAVLAEREFATLEAATDAESRLKHARALVERRALDDAVRVLEALLAGEPSAAAYATLAGIHAGRHDVPAERALLEKMLALYPSADDRPVWRVRLATIDLDLPSRTKDEWNAKLSTAVAALRALLGDSDADVHAMAVIRTELGRRLSQQGDHDAAHAELAWVLEHGAATRSAPLALLETGNVRWRQGDYAAARECFVRILEEFPRSDEAARAPEGIRNCDQRLNR